MACPLLVFAAERGLLPELEPEAIAVVEQMARFTHYTNNFERDGFDRMERAIQSLFALATPAADALLSKLLRSPNAMVRKAFEYQDEVVERLKKLGPTDSIDELDLIAGRSLAESAIAVELGVPRFVLGQPVHGICFVRGRIVVAGGGRIAPFAEVGGGVVVASFGELRATDRCERVLAFGEEIVAASGKNLGWLSADGELLAERETGVTSSWIQHLYAIDVDRFFVTGYDEPRLQLWSARERRRVAEAHIEHRHDDGRFARPYGIRVHRPSRRILISYWDHQIDVFSLAEDRFQLERTLVLHTPLSQVGLSDDERTLFVGEDHVVAALAYPSLAPIWRWETTRELTAFEILGDGRVAVGAKDGALIIVGGR